jgi:phosphohistidine swiveling domain-containing protein
MSREAAVALKTIYTCMDGSDFPVEWQDPRDAEIIWRLDAEHWSQPCTDLETELLPHAMQEGVRHAFEIFDLPSLDSNFFRVLVVNGYAFLPVVSPDADEAARKRTVWREFTQKNGGPRSVWEGLCQPRMREACDELAKMPDDGDAGEVIERMWKGFGFSVLDGTVGLIGLIVPLFQFCTAEFEEDADVLVGELIQGFSNLTLEADEALWQLAERVKASDSLHRAISSVAIDLATLHADREFWSRFQGFLDVHGRRASHWQLSAPSLQEEPEETLAIIGRLVASDSPSPMAQVQVAAKRREELISELESRLAKAPEKLEAFQRLVNLAADYGPIREGHAYWQLQCFGYARQALLRIGERIVDEGRISEAEDVLFLNQAEVGGAGLHDMRSSVARRRKLWNQRHAVSPPQAIGKGSAQVLDSKPWWAAVAQSAPANILRGVPASRGRATGRARIIRSPSEGGRLAPGEVLVCELTAPPWTPLFGVAAAVITETGGALSHPAIVAREYGIPCVVGASSATSRIKDGQLITVDGTKGEVRLETG